MFIIKRMIFYIYIYILYIYIYYIHFYATYIIIDDTCVVNDVKLCYVIRTSIRSDTLPMKEATYYIGQRSYNSTIPHP